MVGDCVEKVGLDLNKDLQWTPTMACFQALDKCNKVQRSLKHGSWVSFRQWLSSLEEAKL